MCAACLFVGIVSIVICHRASNGKLKRNGYVGIRVPAMYMSEEAWRSGHRAVLRFSWLCTVITAGLSAAVMHWVSSTDVSSPIVVGVLITGTLLWTAIYSAIAAIVGSAGANRVAAATKE